jgi:hypothetical protein
MLYTTFKDTQIGFVARYQGRLGDGTKEGNANLFLIHTEDKIIIDQIKREGFIIALDEPVNTFIDSGTERIDATHDQIELLNVLYEAIHLHYSS